MGVDDGNRFLARRERREDVAAAAPRPCSGLVSALARRYHRSCGRTSSRRPSARRGGTRTRRPIADVFSSWPRRAPRHCGCRAARGASRDSRAIRSRWESRAARPTHDSVVLWTRLAPEALFGSTPSGDPITVRWEIAHDDKFDRIVQRGQSVASAALADSVHVEVAGLEPDRWYFYRFMAGDAQSAVGRTRTFPAPDAAASRLRIAYASCQRWEHGYFSAYRHMRQENPDVVLFLGDYIYEYPNAKNAVRVPTGGWVRSLADYRARYALHKSDPDLQAMHAVCPWLLTWDDHEVQNDYAGLKEGQSGTPVADFAALARRGVPGVLRAHAAARRGPHPRLRRSRERRRDAHPFQRALRHAGVVPSRRRPAVSRSAGLHPRRQSGLEHGQSRKLRRVAGSQAHVARCGAGSLARRRVRARKQGLERSRSANAVRAARFPVRTGPTRSGTTAGTATPLPAPA